MYLSVAASVCNMSRAEWKKNLIVLVESMSLQVPWKISMYKARALLFASEPLRGLKMNKMLRELRTLRQGIFTETSVQTLTRERVHPARPEN